jgi:hypothetical protein
MIREGLLLHGELLGALLLCLTVLMSASGPGCVKTHTSAKCGKYNSPTRYRAICAQHDLALMMRNFSNMFLRARRALEFSHGLGQIRSFGFVGSMSGLPESGHGWAIYEYTP